ncbi:hypothetical protein [Mycoplasma hafezii]|uniref:hypothetical protein n=1 Tax=Mycoplasma hafezii TaxID=525886 RepID=UPI003CE9AB38
MTKYKLTKIVSLTILTAIFSIVATLSFIPTIKQTSQTQQVVEHLNYSNINFIVTVTITAICTFAALVSFIKKIYTAKKEDAFSKKDRLLNRYLIFGGTFVVLAVIITLFGAIGYKVFLNDIQIPVLPDGVNTQEQPIFNQINGEFAATNNYIKQILLSFVYIYSIALFIFIVYKIVIAVQNKKQNQNEPKEVLV